MGDTTTGTLPPAYTGSMRTFAVHSSFGGLTGYGVVFTDGRCLVSYGDGSEAVRYRDEDLMRRSEGPFSVYEYAPPHPGAPWPRRFMFTRHSDVTGFSGTGAAMEGVAFPGGGAWVMWLGEYKSLVEWPSVEMAVTVHGHGGATEFRWIDPAPERTSP